MNDRNQRWAFAAVLFIGALLPRDVMAVDGAIEINQAAAMAGAVTPGDAPGFPVVLTLPGSYVMTSNLTLPNTNTDAIELATATASIVIDMNGFFIIGPGTCTPACPVTSCTGGTGRGIFSTSPILGVGIRRGGVQGVGAAGIDVIGGVSLENIYLGNNGGGGLKVTSGGSRLQDVIPSRNGGDGIHADTNFPVRAREVTTSCNQGDGIEAGIASTIVDSTALTNGGRGLLVGISSKVKNNLIMQNAGFGLECGTLTGIAGNIFSVNNGVSAQFSADCNQLESNLCDGSPCPDRVAALGAHSPEARLPA